MHRRNLYTEENKIWDLIRLKLLDSSAPRWTSKHQQALVKKIEGVQPVTPIKRVIPGGSTLHELPIDTLPSAVYTWLRACTHFTEGTPIPASCPEELKTKTRRIIDFDTKTRNAEWEVRGKRWLAERIVELLKIKNIVAIEIKRDGLTVVMASGSFGPKSKAWEPYIELVPLNHQSFRRLIWASTILTGSLS